LGFGWLFVSSAAVLGSLAFAPRVIDRTDGVERVVREAWSVDVA
jgi:hypothetical protein